MRRNPFDPDIEPPNPFTECLDLTARERRFQTQDIATGAGDRTEMRQSGFAADLLVPREKEYEVLARIDFLLVKNLTSEKGEDDPALHIEDAGTVSPPCFYSKGASVCGTCRPDGIEMSQDHDRLSRPLAFINSFQSVAPDRVAQDFHDSAAISEPRSQKHRQRINSWLVVRTGFDLDDGSQEIQSAQEVRLEIFD